MEFEKLQNIIAEVLKLISKFRLRRQKRLYLWATQ